MADLYHQIKDAIHQSGAQRVLIHSDLLRGFRLRLPPNEGLLAAHCKMLLGLGADVYMPTFNYDYPSTRLYDVANDVSKIGVITEYFRKNVAQWRTPVPIFSVAGVGYFPEITSENTIDPFDEGSVFGFLHRTGSLIMHYGSEFHATTFIHYVERVSGVLSYRYDKLFEGAVLNNGVKSSVTLKFHVRPMGRSLDYDWGKLERDLVQAGLIQCFSEGATRILLLSAKDLVSFWIDKLSGDRLYLLNATSREWVDGLLNKLGRPFVQSDFEA